jgi:hypothetical protein
MSIPTLPSLGSFRDGMNRVTMNGCDLRYLRTGAGTPVVLLHPGAGAAGVLRPAAAPHEHRGSP